MTYTVLSGTLNPTISYHTLLTLSVYVCKVYTIIIIIIIPHCHRNSRHMG